MVCSVRGPVSAARDGFPAIDDKLLSCQSDPVHIQQGVWLFCANSSSPEIGDVNAAEEQSTKLGRSVIFQSSLECGDEGRGRSGMEENAV